MGDCEGLVALAVMALVAFITMPLWVLAAMVVGDYMDQHQTISWFVVVGIPTSFLVHMVRGWIGEMKDGKYWWE